MDDVYICSQVLPSIQETASVQSKSPEPPKVLVLFMNRLEVALEF